MAVFYVGQRVRVVSVGGGSTCKHLLGKEGVVSSLTTPEDRADLVMVEVGGEEYVCRTGQLEPIRPIPSAAGILAMTQLPEGPVRERVYA